MFNRQLTSHCFFIFKNLESSTYFVFSEGSLKKISVFFFASIYSNCNIQAQSIFFVIFLNNFKYPFSNPFHRA